MSWVGAGWRSACANLSMGVVLLSTGFAGAQAPAPPRAGFPPVTQEPEPEPAPAPKAPAPEAPAPAPKATPTAPVAPTTSTERDAPPGARSDSHQPPATETAPTTDVPVPYRAPIVSPPVSGQYVPPIQTPAQAPATQPATTQKRPLDLPPSPALPPPPSNICNDGRSSAYETGVDCGGLCGPCPIDSACQTQNDCTSGLCKAFVCHERPYTPGEPLPPGYHVETSTSDRATTARRAGIGFFVLSYGASYVGALTMPSSLTWLYVPLIGPWPLIGKAEEFAPDGGVSLTKMLLVTDGAFQIAGALMWLGGTLGRGQQLLRDETQPDPAPTATFWISPSVALGGYGLRVDALF